jgi:hypothetical protein
MHLSESLLIPMSSTKRGKAVQIRGLHKTQQAKFRRAVALAGSPSVSSWLSTAIRRLIAEQEAKYGNLMAVLTPDEADVVLAVRSGSSRLQGIAEETHLSLKKAEAILEELAGRGVLRKSRALKTTEQARGATVWEYFLAK